MSRSAGTQTKFRHGKADELMNRLEDLDIVEVDIFDQAFIADTAAGWSRALEKNWLARYNHGYALLDSEAMQDFASDERCRPPNADIVKMMGAAPGTPFERFTGHFLTALNGDEHKRLRSLLARSFTPRQANMNRQFMQDRINSVLDQVSSKGECDFLEVIAEYPISILCRMVGFAPDDIPAIQHYLERLSGAFSLDPQQLNELNEIFGHLFSYASKIIEHRRGAGEHPQDLVQDLCDLTGEGDKLSDEELRVLLITLLGAGYDTTKNQLAFMMKLLCDHPHEWEQLLNDASRVKPFIEESLRFLNPNPANYRVTNVDVVYRDVLFPANTMIMIPEGFAGRDPKKNAEPTKFDPDRLTKFHMTFGSGAHYCLGIFLARALMEEALPVIVRRLKRPRQTAPMRLSDTWGGILPCRSLRIAFEPETLGS